MSFTVASPAGEMPANFPAPSGVGAFSGEAS